MKKKVLIWISLVSCVGRDVCRGVYRYAGLHAPEWEVLHVEPAHAPLDTLASWELDGLMGPFGRSDYAELAAKAAPFCVNLHGGKPFCNLPQTGVNDRLIGETAAAYLLKRGFEHFGYYGFNGLMFSDDRWGGFRTHLAEHRKTATRFTDPGFVFAPAAPKNFEEQFRPALTKWLTSQPRPFALFVVDDMRTNLIYSICRDAGLVIPDDIALLGVNDDDIYCFKNSPPLSSVQVPSQIAGYRAARMMHRMFKEKKKPAKPVLLNPGTVTERASTAALSLKDRHVVNALRFIASSSTGNPSTEKIARAAGLSRRVLEKRFRTLLNSSPQAEVRRAQIERVKVALRETSLSLEEIAETTGFASGNYLSQVFKKTTGQTPGAYRRSFR